MQPRPQEIWSQDVTAATHRAADWIWQGFVTRGGITLLIADASEVLVQRIMN
jgi:hypothetical protein